MKKITLVAVFAGLLFATSAGYAETPKAVKEQPQIFSISNNAP